MVQMIPNSAMIKGSVSEIEPYDKQTGYSVIILKVNTASEKKEEAFLFNKAEDSKIKVLISNQEIDKLKLKVKDTVVGELKKVNVDLWKAVKISSK